MANVSYDIMWREAMMELLDQLEAENPDDPALAPKDLSEWACIYIKYLQIFRKLELAYDQMLHPQKRIDLLKALEACMGRMLEVKHWMIKLNRGLEYINLDEILVDLKLGPEVLEVPVPRYYVEDRAKELDDRDKFLEALVEKYKAGGPRPLPTIPIGPAYGREDAILMIQCNERGRQARVRARIMAINKRQRQLEDKRAQTGAAMSTEEAIIRIQRWVRGTLYRRRVKRMAHTEQVFINMRPKPRDPKRDPQVSEAKNMLRRKRLQLDHLKEYDEAIESLKQRVLEMEGQDMRETIQDRINAWFVENRNDETGEYPDFPDEDDGGSKTILNPKLPTVESILADVGDAANGKRAGSAKGGSKPGSARPGSKPGSAKGGKRSEAGDAPAVEETITSTFIAAIENSVQDFVARWQDRDESDNFGQKHDAELIKDELRPIVFEEVRQQVDREMAVLLGNLKDMVEAEKAAKLGKKGKKKKGKKKKKKGKGGKGKGKGKKKKDPTADRSMESLFAELVSNGILQQCPHVHVQDYQGSSSFLASALEKAKIIPDPSIAQVRQVLTEHVILPLGSQLIHEKAPGYCRSVLLYGADKTGKTLLSQALASCTGANFFDLSPRNTDGKYPGRAVSLMIHMVFKVARTMAPSVIYIDEAEKIFISDKKRLREFGSAEPFSRIKKDLAKEVKLMKPGERVLIVGNTKEPWILVPKKGSKKDEKAFVSFWSRHVFLPMPDYASRRMLWPGLFERYGGHLELDFDLSTLCHISDSFTSGHLDMVVRSMLTKRRLERLRDEPITLPEVLAWLCKLQPVTKDVDEGMRRFRDKTPIIAALKAADKPADKVAEEGKDGKEKGKGAKGAGDKKAAAAGGKKKKK